MVVNTLAIARALRSLAVAIPCVCQLEFEECDRKVVMYSWECDNGFEFVENDNYVNVNDELLVLAGEFQ